MGSMNMPGVSLSLLNLNNVSADTGLSIATLMEYMDAEHMSPCWPVNQKNVYPLPANLRDRKRTDAFIDVEAEHKAPAPTGPPLKVDPATIQRALTLAAQDVVALEPDLTKWDTIVGDGDCGETCEMGGRAVLAAVKNGLGADGDLVHLFRELTEIIDEACGGTLGAIFSIFLAGMTTALMEAAAQSPQPVVDAALFGKCARDALDTLGQRTAAREGHRTVMDALIPFANALAATGDVNQAAAKCRAGGEGTATLTAKLGRAAYVGDRTDTTMPPDPGAMAFVAVAEGIAKAVDEKTVNGV